MSAAMFIPKDASNRPDIELFLNWMYKYYCLKGFKQSALCLFSEMIATIFTLVVLTFVLFFVDWSLISTCSNKEKCESAIHGWTPTVLNTSCMLLFISYFVFKIIHTYQEAQRLNCIRKFYQIINVTDCEIHILSWKEIVNKLLNYHEMYPLCARQLDLRSVNDVLMYHDNAIIELVRINLIPHWLVTEHILHCFKLCMSDMCRIDTHLSRVERRAIIVSSFLCITMPFALLYATLYFCIIYVNSLRSFAHMTDLNFTRGGEYKLRKIHELPHILNSRLKNDVKYIEQYVSQHTNTFVFIISCVSTCILGSFWCIIILISFVNEQALVHIHIPSETGRDLVWWLAITTTCVAIIQQPKACVYSSDELMIHMKRFSNDSQIPLYTIRNIYLPTWKIILHEWFGYILCPFILLYWVKNGHYSKIIAHLQTLKDNSSDVEHPEDWMKYVDSALMQQVDVLLNQMSDRGTVENCESYSEMNTIQENTESPTHYTCYESPHSVHKN